jgi:hypothetical protein
MAEQASAAFLRQLLSLNGQLVARSHHGLSPRFVQELTRWVLSGCRAWVCRKGRRGGGTTTAILFLVAFALFGKWKVARGDTPVIVVMSHSLAAGRDVLRRISMMLTDLGVDHEATADKIAIPSRGIEFRNYAPNLVSFLGITAVAIFLDELAHWRDSDSGANPSREILARLLPTMATVPEARLLLVSSPAGLDDVHAEKVTQGDTSEQCVSIVPSWEGNPTLTEEGCRRDATDETAFLREYAAQPQETKTLKPFDRAEVDHALARDFDRGRPAGKRVVCADPSSGTGGDAFAWLVAGWNQRSDGTRVLVVDRVEAERGKWAHRKGGAEVCAALAADAKRFGAELVATDQRETLLMTTELPRHGLRVEVFPHQTESKTTAVERLQLLLAEGQLALPQREGNRVKKQLLDFQQTETRTGLKRFASRQSAAGGDDLVAALLTLMMADAAGLLEGSPNARTRRKDPKPRAIGEPSQWASTSGASILDRVEVDQRTGRVHVGRQTRSQFDGGSF